MMARLGSLALFLGLAMGHGCGFWCGCRYGSCRDSLKLESSFR